MIPREELARLAVFYDRFANHLDPLSNDWKRRKHEYLGALNDLHQRYGARIAKKNSAAKRNARVSAGCVPRTNPPLHHQRRELVSGGFLSLRRVQQVLQARSQFRWQT